MERHERLSQILDFVVSNGHVRVEEIVEALGVSPATVRRDLEVLDSQELITRTRGGAARNPESGSIPIRYRLSGRAAIKDQIAQAVAATVQPGDVIGLNGGTTTTAIARQIALRVAADERFEPGSVTIVTNAVNIAYELAVRPQLQVAVVGGMVRPQAYELVGPLSELILPAINIDRLYLGVVAIDLQRGLFNNDAQEARVNAALVKAARQVAVVAEQSKIGASAFAKICDLSAVGQFYTDGPLDEQHRRALEALPLEVITA